MTIKSLLLVGRTVAYNQNMMYNEQLNDRRWKECRENILKRDNYKCQNIICKTYEPIHIGKLCYGPLTIHEFEKRFGMRLITNSITKDTSYLVFVYEGLKILKNDRMENIKNQQKHVKIIEALIEPFSLSSVEILTFKVRPKSGWPLEALDYFAALKGVIRKMNVHHKKYIEGKMAWEYEPNDLITICEECHQRIHIEGKIPFYLENRVVIPL